MAANPLGGKKDEGGGTAPLKIEGTADTVIDLVLRAEVRSNLVSTGSAEIAEGFRIFDEDEDADGSQFGTDPENPNGWTDSGTDDIPAIGFGGGVGAGDATNIPDYTGSGGSGAGGGIFDLPTVTTLEEDGYGSTIPGTIANLPDNGSDELGQSAMNIYRPEIIALLDFEPLDQPPQTANSQAPAWTGFIGGLSGNQPVKDLFDLRINQSIIDRLMTDIIFSAIANNPKIVDAKAVYETAINGWASTMESTRAHILHKMAALKSYLNFGVYANSPSFRINFISKFLNNIAPVSVNPAGVLDAEEFGVAGFNLEEFNRASAQLDLLQLTDNTNNVVFDLLEQIGGLESASYQKYSSSTIIYLKLLYSLRQSLILGYPSLLNTLYDDPTVLEESPFEVGYSAAATALGENITQYYNLFQQLGTYETQNLSKIHPWDDPIGFLKFNFILPPGPVFEIFGGPTPPWHDSGSRLKCLCTGLARELSISAATGWFANTKPAIAQNHQALMSDPPLALGKEYYFNDTVGFLSTILTPTGGSSQDILHLDDSKIQFSESQRTLAGLAKISGIKDVLPIDPLSLTASPLAADSALALSFDAFIREDLSPNQTGTYPGSLLFVDTLVNPAPGRPLLEIERVQNFANLLGVETKNITACLRHMFDYQHAWSTGLSTRFFHGPSSSGLGLQGQGSLTPANTLKKCLWYFCKFLKPFVDSGISPLSSAYKTKFMIVQDPSNAPVVPIMDNLGNTNAASVLLGQTGVAFGADKSQLVMFNMPTDNTLRNAGYMIAFFKSVQAMYTQTPSSFSNDTPGLPAGMHNGEQVMAGAKEQLFRLFYLYRAKKMLAKVGAIGGSSDLWRNAMVFPTPTVGDINLGDLPAGKLAGGSNLNTALGYQLIASKVPLVFPDNSQINALWASTTYTSGKSKVVAAMTFEQLSDAIAQSIDYICSPGDGTPGVPSAYWRCPLVTGTWDIDYFDVSMLYPATAKTQISYSTFWGHLTDDAGGDMGGNNVFSLGEGFEPGYAVVDNDIEADLGHQFSPLHKAYQGKIRDYLEACFADDDPTVALSGDAPNIFQIMNDCYESFCADAFGKSQGTELGENIISWAESMNPGSTTTALHKLATKTISGYNPSGPDDNTFPAAFQGYTPRVTRASGLTEFGLMTVIFEIFFTLMQQISGSMSDAVLLTPKGSAGGTGPKGAGETGGGVKGGFKMNIVANRLIYGVLKTLAQTPGHGTPTSAWDPVTGDPIAADTYGLGHGFKMALQTMLYKEDAYGQINEGGDAKYTEFVNGLLDPAAQTLGTIEEFLTLQKALGIDYYKDMIRDLYTTEARDNGCLIALETYGEQVKEKADDLVSYLAAPGGGSNSSDESLLDVWGPGSDVQAKSDALEHMFKGLNNFQNQASRFRRREKLNLAAVAGLSDHPDITDVNDLPQGLFPTITNSSGWQRQRQEVIESWMAYHPAFSAVEGKNIKNLCVGIPRGMLDYLQLLPSTPHSLDQDGWPIVANDFVGSKNYYRYQTLITINVYRENQICPELIFKPQKFVFDAGLFIRELHASPGIGGGGNTEYDIAMATEWTKIKSAFAIEDFSLIDQSGQSGYDKVYQKYYAPTEFSPFSQDYVDSVSNTFSSAGVSAAHNLLRTHITSEIMFHYYRILYGVDLQAGTFLPMEMEWLNDSYVTDDVANAISELSMDDQIKSAIPSGLVDASQLFIKDEVTDNAGLKEVLKVLGIVKPAGTSSPNLQFDCKKVKEWRFPKAGPGAGVEYSVNGNNTPKLITKYEYQSFRQLTNIKYFQTPTHMLDIFTNRLFDRTFMVTVDMDHWLIDDSPGVNDSQMLEAMQDEGTIIKNEVGELIFNPSGVKTVNPHSQQTNSFDSFHCQIEHMRGP